MSDVSVDMSSVRRTFIPNFFLHQCCQHSFHNFSAMRPKSIPHHQHTNTHTQTNTLTHTNTHRHTQTHTHTTRTHTLNQDNVIVVMVFTAVMMIHCHASCQTFSLMTQRTSKRSPVSGRKLNIVFPARIKSYSRSLSRSSTRHFPLSKYGGHGINFHKLVFGIIVGRSSQGIE